MFAWTDVSRKRWMISMLSFFASFWTSVKLISPGIWEAASTHIKAATKPLSVWTQGLFFQDGQCMVIAPKELSHHLLPIRYHMVLQIPNDSISYPAWPIFASSKVTASMHGSHSMRHPGASGFLPHPISTKGESGVPCQAHLCKRLPHSLLLCCSKVSMDNLGKQSTSMDALSFSLNMSGVFVANSTAAKSSCLHAYVAPVPGIYSGTHDHPLCPLTSFISPCLTSVPQVRRSFFSLPTP